MHCHFLVLLGVACLVVVPGRARRAAADWPPEGLPLCGACNAGGVLVTPDGVGGAFVVWVDFRNSGGGMNLDIYMQHATGSGQIAPGWPADGFPVCTDPAFQALNSIVPDGLGGVLVAWYDNRNVAPAGTSSDIYAQRILAEGSLALGWPVNGAPVTRAPGRQTWPAIAADGSGGTFVTWHDDATLDIYVQRLAASGEVAPGWLVNGLPVCTLPSAQGYPLAAPDGTGGVLVAWGHAGGDLPDGVLAAYAQRVTASGEIAPGWPENGTRIVLDRALRGLIPDGAGGAYLSCATLGFLDSLYFVQRFTASGEIAPGWPEGGAPVCTAPRDRGGIRMVPDGAGGVLLAWYDYRDIFDDEVFVQRIRPDGTRSPGWPVDGLRITDNTAFDNDPDLAPDGMGGAYVCWDRISAPLGTDNRVVIQHVTGAGTVAPGWPAAGLVIPGDDWMSDPRITADGYGGAIVAWRHGCCGVRALRIAMDGPTPVQVLLLRAEAEPDRVRLTWYAAEPSLGVTVERRTEASPWQALGVAAGSGDGYFHFEDRTVTPGARYAYRLRLADRASLTHSTAVWVDVPARAAFALRGLSPNPCLSDAVVAFSLPTGAPATLELYDAQGRRALAREVGSLGPGSHRLRLEAGRTLPAGVYTLRLTQAARSVTTRGVVIR